MQAQDYVRAVSLFEKSVADPFGKKIHNTWAGLCKVRWRAT
jgi:hypothetical protein